MTGKLKQTASNSSNYTKFEFEAQKLRNENKWLRLQEFCSSSSTKEKKIEMLIKFYYAEANLENHLFSNPIILNSNESVFDQIDSKSSSSKLTARNILYEIELVFKDAISKSDSKSVVMEASILLTKLFYSQKRYQEANNLLNGSTLAKVLSEHIAILKKFQQNQLPSTDNLRQMQLFAELHSIRGLCLESKKSAIQGSSSETNKPSSSDEQEIIDSYEISSLFAIQHSISLHQLINSQIAATPVQGSMTSNIANDSNPALTSLNVLNNNDDNLDLINPLYEVSLQKAPLLYIKKGDYQMGIKKFRDLLLKKNIQSITSIRQVLLRKFSECLLFNIPLDQYKPLGSVSGDDRLKIYKPANRDEEILLSLNLSQYLASTEVMIFRHPQFKSIRELTFKNAIASLDLLLFYLSYYRSFNVISEKFEMTMKYSFEQFYVWYQYGLSLISDQKYQKAYLILKECSRMDPDHTTVYLLLAKIALENLFLIDEAIEWSNKVLSKTENKNLKAHIILGCSLCIKAKLQKQHNVQINYYEQALESFKKAHAIDQSDFLPLYHMAHCYSILRQINESIDYVSRALKLKPDDKESLHLLALLLTSTKNYEEAHTIMSKVCSLYDDVELLYTKIRIEEILFGFNISLSSLFNLIWIYKQSIQTSGTSGGGGGSTASSSVSVQPSNVAGTNYKFSTGQNQATTPAANQVTDSLSTFESASLLNLQNIYKLNESLGKTVSMLIQTDQLSNKYGGSFIQSQNIQHVLILVRILAQIGEFYLRHDKINDAENCCQEISYIHPMSYLHIYLKGRIFEYKQEYLQAKLCYQNALSLNPYHIQSLQQMSLILCQMQNFHLAEKMIRDAISLNSSLPESWHILARVLDYQNDNQSALKCYQTCLQLEATNPIIPFSSLTRIF